jgi:opacity protein-like surface antigen
VKNKVVLFALVAVLGASPARAATGDFWFGLTAGISNPTGDFTDIAEMGFHGVLTGTYMVTPVFGIGADIGYHGFGVDDEVVPIGGEASLNAIQATVHGTFRFQTTGKAVPYIQGGLGVYRYKEEVEGSLDPFEDFEFTESNFGFYLGGGVNLAMSPAYEIGLGVGYHSISTEDFSTNFFTVGVNFMWGTGP